MVEVVRAGALVARVGAGAVALASALLTAWLAWHHPLSPAWALGGCLLLASLSFVRPALWPLWLLPLVPWIGLMPWSGWLIVEELDLAVLAVAAGGYLRMAGGWPSGALEAPLNTLPLQPAPSRSRSKSRSRGRSRARTRALHPSSIRALAPVLLWLLPLAASTLISASRGVADAGGLVFGWWQGYQEPLNALRLAKPLAEVLLLLPLWRAACSADAAMSQRLVKAMSLLLVGVAAWVLWERLAHTGLLDFSSDYRATGPFWEMHIGGAGLDAALALALPFAVAGLAAARTPLQYSAAAAVLLLGLYAALVTFSRIVYAAVPMGIVVWLVLRAWQGPQPSAAGTALQPADGRPWRALGVALAWLVGFALAAWWSFPASGYRGLLALLGAVSLLLPLASVLRRQNATRWLQGAAGGLLAAALVAAAAWAMPKGAYIAYAVCWLAGALALLHGRRRPGGGVDAVALAAFIGTLAAWVFVGVRWGGPAAWPSGVAVAAGLAVVALVAGRRRSPAWPESWRWQGQMAGVLVAVAALVGVFGGGAYMGQRMADTAQDGGGRVEHWRHALSLLRGDDWLFGKGLGRFWGSQWLSERPQDHAGEHRLLAPVPGRDSAAAVLTSGQHDLGSAQALQLSQRVPQPAPGLATLRLNVRTAMTVRLDAGLCSKHLLYPAQCQGQQLVIEARPGVWQEVEMRFKGESINAGPWYAPRLVVFSASLGRHANRIEIDQLRLADAAGGELLVNGGFEQGLARWFFTSDRYHMPFHAKNLAVHLLFEQGLLGLAAFGLLTAAALWRLATGAARRHPLAPVLAGALAALLAVGLVDSLLDMPRIAFLVLLLLAMALCLPAGERAAAPQRGP